MSNLADKFAITEQLYRYCRSVDRLDTELGHGVFHEDALAVFPSFTGTGRGWIDHICEGHLAFTGHSHQITNVLIEVEGDRAGSESYVTAVLHRADSGKLLRHTFQARYIDQWSRREGRWAIDRRECLVDLGTLSEINELPGSERSCRDADDPSYAVLKGTS